MKYFRLRAPPFIIIELNLFCNRGAEIMQLIKFKLVFGQKEQIKISCGSYTQLLQAISQMNGNCPLSLITIRIPKLSNEAEFKNKFLPNKEYTCKYAITSMKQEKPIFKYLLYSLYFLYRNKKLREFVLNTENSNQMLLSLKEVFRYFKQSQSMQTEGREVMAKWVETFFELCAYGDSINLQQHFSFQKIITMFFNYACEELINKQFHNSFTLQWEAEVQINCRDRENIMNSRYGNGLKITQRWFMQCSLTKKTILQNIKDRINMNVKRWDNSLGISHSYQQRLRQIVKLPPFLLIECNPYGQLPDKQVWETQNFGGTFQVHPALEIPYILNLKELCTPNLQQQLQKGLQQRKRIMDELAPISSEDQAEYKYFQDYKDNYQLLYEQLFVKQNPAWELNRYDKCHPTGIYRFIGGVFVRNEPNQEETINNNSGNNCGITVFMEEETNEGSKRWFKYSHSRKQLKLRQYINELPFKSSASKLVPLLLMFSEIRMQYDSRYIKIAQKHPNN